MAMKYETLMDLTGQESGVIIFEGGNIIVCNWANSAPFGGFPRVFGADPELLTLDEKEEIAVEKTEEFTGSIERFLDGDGEVLYDRNGDLDSLLSPELQGTAYRLENGMIIVAPKGWC